MIDAPDRGPEHRIVVAHDWLCGLRGGEQVLERACALVDRTWGPGAALMVMFDDGRMLTPTVDRWRLRGVVHASTLNRIPGAARWWRRWLFPLYPRAVEGLSRQLAWIHEERPIDLVISTSSAAIKGLRSPPGVPHLCCCFSPARYVWEEGLYPPDESLKGRLRSAGLKRFGGRFREWDRRTAANVTRFVAISGHIRERIRAAYGVEAEIVFPPARTEYFTVDDSVAREDFWLCVGALETYKRADLAAEAAVAAGVPLKIVGTGSQRSALRRRFGGHKSIEFLGHVHDLDLRDLYRRAKALVFPQVEDFGIVAVEAQACGLPVVAFGAGGASDIVIDGRTGVLFGEQTAEAIVRAAQRVPSNAGAACRQNAERFSEAKFDEALAAQILAVCPGLKPRERPGYAS